MSKIKLYRGDCLDIMPKLPDKSIDMILCDLPYGTTACKWDSIIDLDKLWPEYKRLIKANAAIVLHSSQPFTTKLISSNIENYRHQWYWNKNNSAGFATAKIRPMQIIEDILVFGYGKVNYYPLMEKRGKVRKKGGYSESENYGVKPSVSYNNSYYPKSLISISNASQKGKTHPTQKPVELLEYLIKTYTTESETVLDNTMGSGSTGVACVNTNRNFIGIEKDCPKDGDKHFRTSIKRITEAGGRGIEVIG